MTRASRRDLRAGLRWRLSSSLRGSPATRWLPDRTRLLAGATLDAVDRARGVERPWYEPPRALRLVGGGGQSQVGSAYVSLLREHAGLERGSDVLDIGCGVGRLAVALIRELELEGRYEGFDVVPEAIAWCRREVATRHPNFAFTLLDLHNRRYRPRGSASAATARFPYEDACFDLAVAMSVFTHLLPRESENYLREAHRVLRPAGILASTWFLLEDLDDGSSEARGRFPHEIDGARAASRRVPEFGLALPRERVIAMHEAAGLEAVRVLPGGWRRLEGGRAQDLVIATAPPEPR